MNISAGVIVQDGRVLICQRAAPHPYAGLWEFPGGKQEADEDPAGCLVRECLEELSLAIYVVAQVATLDYDRGDVVQHFSFFLARPQDGTPQRSEHQAIQWVAPDMLYAFDFCPADQLALPDILRALQAAEPTNAQ